MDKLDKPTKSVEVFESRSRILFINQNVTSVVRFFSWPVQFTFRWLDRIDKTIRKHLSQQEKMKILMATSRLFMSPNDMGWVSRASLGSTLSSSSNASPV